MLKLSGLQGNVKDPGPFFDATAVVVALQLGLDYWFYLYLVWFFPFLIVALFARYQIAEPA